MSQINIVENFQPRVLENILGLTNQTTGTFS